MKKLCALLLPILFVICLSSCGEGELEELDIQTNQKTENSKKVNSEPSTIDDLNGLIR